MMTEIEPVPPGVDPTAPSPARLYDYYLGGTSNFPAGRAAAEQLKARVPDLADRAWANRGFHGRAARWMAAEEGIRQFVDIGSGLPTQSNTHDAVHAVAPEARVVYVDNDPVVVSHARALLSTPRTVAVHGDLTRPDELLSDPDIRAVIDFSKPVAILLVAVLHFVPDEADPVGCVAKLRDAMAPGSHLVISHVELSPGQVVGARPATGTARELGEARRGMPPARARTRGEVGAFFGDMTLLDPGLTDVWAWRPEDDSVTTASDFMTVIGGVARKD